MAHVFLKEEKIVNLGLGLLDREIVLPGLVTKFRSTDYIGAKNDTINIPIPSLLAGREYGWRNNRSSPIVVDDLVEQSLPITLDTHVYSAVSVTDEQLTLDIASFGEQVARPQVYAVARKLEAGIADVMVSADTKHSVTYEPGDGGAEDVSFYVAALEAKKALDDENVPTNGRVLLLGSEVEFAALQSPHLIKVDQAGSDSALREAEVGRIAGFGVYRSNSVATDFAVAFHPTAFGFANLAPAVPSGATAGATANYSGLAMRWIRDYDAPYLRDRSVYSSFAGFTSVEDSRDMDPESGTFGDLTGKNVRAVEIAYSAGS